MIDVARDWLVAETATGLVGHSVLTPRAPADGAISVGVDGTVHPDHRGQGIGSELVATGRGPGPRLRRGTRCRAPRAP